jgi:hypothetical protein
MLAAGVDEIVEKPPFQCIDVKATSGVIALHRLSLFSRARQRRAVQSGGIGAGQQAVWAQFRIESHKGAGLFQLAAHALAFLVGTVTPKPT